VEDNGLEVNSVNSGDSGSYDNKPETVVSSDAAGDAFSLELDRLVTIWPSLSETTRQKILELAGIDLLPSR
jgi:hypothetical protein